MLHAQYRNATFLIGNGVVGAAAGLLFWVLATRVLGLSPAEIGVGSAVAVAATLLLAALGERFGLAPISALGWAAVGGIGLLLVSTWLADSYFLAEGDARPSFHRNVVLSIARLLAIVPLVALGVPEPIPLAWALALGASAVAAAVFARRIAPRDGPAVSRRTFLRSAATNVSGSAAETLPGLLLVPVVLAIAGPEAAGVFGIAWAGASLLLLASAAIGRSAFAEIVRNGPGARPAAIRRGLAHHALMVAPATLAFLLLAPYVLAFFGAEYANEGATTLRILAASTLFLAPCYFYLALLRAEERTGPLVAFPIALLVVLLLAVGPATRGAGIDGTAAAWAASAVPFGAFAAWRLARAAKEVTRPHAAPTLRGASHVE
ncbi:MAG: hypothetical protein ACT4PT_08800 [Methanobacteriota archaeon]